MVTAAKGLTSGWSQQEWDLAYKSMIALTSAPDEDAEDIISAARSLGEYRSELRGEQFKVWEDVLFAVSLLCLNPWKPPVANSTFYYLSSNRRRIFDSARAMSPLQLRQRFDKAIQPDTLKLTLAELFDRLENATDITKIIDFSQLPPV